MIKNNRYEWQNIAKSDLIQYQAGKIIFLRDIYKQWYVTGINSNINSITKLIHFLYNRTRGYEIITVGNSAGGYMATLCGTLLSAKLIFNFSGQYVLNIGKLNDEYYYLKKYEKNPFYAQYFDIRPFIMSNPNSPIMYFFPSKSNQDQEQYNLIKGLENIFSFSFNQNTHGSSMYGRDMPCVIGTELNILKMLYDIFADKIINPDLFSLNLYWLHTLEYFKFKKLLQSHFQFS